MTPEKILKDHWRCLIRDFTSRQIKYAADRPLAIQAIANEYAKVLKRPYLAGLWGKDLLARELLWTADGSNGRAPRLEGQTAPSWSWFAIEKTVITWEDWPGDYKDDTIEVLGHRVDIHLGYHTVSHETSFLKLKGCLRKATWNRSRAFLISQVGEQPAIFAKTVADEPETPIDLEQLAVETLEVVRTPEKTGAVGLVLVKDEIKRDYRRVRVFSTLEVEDEAAVLGWMKSFRSEVIFLV